MALNSNLAVWFLNKVTKLLNNHIRIKRRVINTKSMKRTVRITVPNTKPSTKIIPASITKRIFVSRFIKKSLHEKVTALNIII